MNNENKTCDKKVVYKCGICGKKHETIAERVKCETSCLKQQEEEAKKVAELKKNEEKNARFTEASKALENALALVNKCVEDYGHFEYKGKIKDLSHLNIDFFPSKLWHHFWI